MILTSRIKDLKTFLLKWGAQYKISKLEVTRLQTFIDNWENELRVQLHLAPTPQATIGVSCNPDIQLQSIPRFKYIPTGFYKTRQNELMFVEVIYQHPESGLITLTTINDNHEVITPCLFAILFEPCNE